jgi:diguanylate cyclase (GGDEF)-like protein
MALEVVVLACCIAVRTWFLVTALGRAARSDALTGVLTRTGLTFELDHDDGGYGLLFCDVDHFKEINDSLGHEAGDRVLQVVADRIRRQLRSGDLIARFGGDEFVVVCRGLDESSLEPLADRIRRRLDGTVDVGRCGVTPVSVSVGAIRVAPGEPFDHALQRADAEMYRVKRDRRPQLAPPPPGPVLVARA